MSQDIETLRAIITHHVTSGSPVQREAFAALDRMESFSATCLRALDMATEKAISAERERDSLRAKLERVKEVLEPFAKEAESWLNSIHDDFRPLCVEPGNADADGGGYAHPGSETFYTLGDLRRARTVLAELSADAPAQQMQISDEAVYAGQVAYEAAMANGERKPLEIMRVAITAALDVERPRR